jgi:hypothetical protein
MKMYPTITPPNKPTAKWIANCVTDKIPNTMKRKNMNNLK